MHTKHVEVTLTTSIPIAANGIKVTDHKRGEVLDLPLPLAAALERDGLAVLGNVKASKLPPAKHMESFEERMERILAANKDPEQPTPEAEPNSGDPSDEPEDEESPAEELSEDEPSEDDPSEEEPSDEEAQAANGAPKSAATPKRAGRGKGKGKQASGSDSE